MSKLRADGGYVANTGEMKNAYKNFSQKTRGTSHLRVSDVDGGIILKFA